MDIVTGGIVVFVVTLIGAAILVYRSRQGDQSANNHLLILFGCAVAANMAMYISSLF